MKFRSFIAVDLSTEIQKNLGRVQRVLRDDEARVRWMAPENIHLTLKFCDSLDANEVLQATDSIVEVFQDSGEVDLTVTGIGTYPDLNLKPDAAPRVIWAGVECSGDFVERVRELDLALMESPGLRPESRLWTPHVTIGRVKSTKGLDSLKSELVKHSRDEFGICRVTKIFLYNSALTQDGPVYSPMSTVHL